MYLDVDEKIYEHTIRVVRGARPVFVYNVIRLRFFYFFLYFAPFRSTDLTKSVCVVRIARVSTESFTFASHYESAEGFSVSISSPRMPLVKY